MMKALNEKINNLYQSQNKNMGGKGLLWMALIFAVLSCYFFIPNIFSEGVIDRVIFRYLIIAFAFMALCYIDILSVQRVTESIIYFVKNQYNYNIIKYPLELFLILCIFKLEMDVTNMIILKVMNHFGISKIKRKVGERQKNKTYDYLIKDDISKYIDEKNNDIKQYEEKQKDSLRYDLEYQKKTIWKFQLVCLIILFFIATFIPDWLFMGHQGDAINVITIFTLIMLYIDKRKEWRY